MADQYTDSFESLPKQPMTLAMFMGALAAVAVVTRKQEVADTIISMMQVSETLLPARQTKEAVEAADAVYNVVVKIRDTPDLLDSFHTTNLQELITRQDPENRKGTRSSVILALSLLTHKREEDERTIN